MNEMPAAKGLNRKQLVLVLGTLLGIALVASALFYVLFLSLTGRDAERQLLGASESYRYIKAEAENGMILHTLLTWPGNVVPEAVSGNVVDGSRTGINGGFFYADDLLSIGVLNGQAVYGENGAYGSGDQNVKYRRGTLVWDEAAGSLSVQRVGSADELNVTDTTRFWAQGGISMTLGNDTAWEMAAAEENAPFPDENRLRSAAVYDQTGRLYLVVSETKGTLAQFRAAIIEEIGDGTLMDGIFLDGDGSSQLYSREAALRGDNRPVAQMLRILHE